MNAEKFFELHTIEEINKKTRISPISLRYIKNKEFEKIQRVKFLGFIKIIEKEYNVDLSSLVEEYNESVNKEKKQQVSIQNNNNSKQKNSSFLLLLLAVILLTLGGYFLYNNLNAKKNVTNLAENFSISQNVTQTQNEINYSEEEINVSDITNENNKTDMLTKEALKQKPSVPKQITIIPQQKVWFRAKNLDTNETKEFLTTNVKVLNGPNWYVKFGHGLITVQYGDKNLTPKTKKILRILFKDGNITVLNKNNRYEK